MLWTIFGRHPFAPGGTGSAIDDTAPFLRAKNLKDFISNDLVRSSIPIQYLPKNPTSGASGVGYGYKATLLPDVCWVYHDAMTAGRLLKSQMHIGQAVACDSLSRATALLIRGDRSGDLLASVVNGRYTD